MARVNRARRTAIVVRLAEYSRSMAVNARTRAEAWQALIPQVNSAPSALETARENVSLIARKAEQKARAASQAAKARSTGQAGTSVVAGGAGGSAGAGATAGSSGESNASSGGASMGASFYGDDAPIPTAAEL